MADKFSFNPQGIIDTAAGGIFGLMLGGYNDRRQYNQQERLQALQIQGQKEMTDYQMMKQMEMWDATNYGAQVEHMKKAGLNPGMIYGMKGGGGVTTGSASGNVTGAQAPQGGREILELAQQQIQMRLLKAQEENIKANTNKTNTEADVIGGVGKEKTVAETENLMQGLSNLREDYQIKRLQQTMMNIENFEKQATQGDRMEYIATQTETAIKILEILKNDKEISDQTLNSKVQIVQQDAIGAVLRNALTQVNINATNEQINKWKVELQQGWKGLDQQAQKIAIEKWVAEAKANFPGISDAIGRLINDGVESIMELTPRGRKSYYNQQK